MNSVTRIFNNVGKPPTFQQLRFRWKKTFRFRYAYGREPLFTEDQYLEAKENDQLESLQYEKIRMVASEETSSPLYDKDLAYFSHWVMKGGRKDLAYDLLHETFYEIKMIQYKKLRKLKAKKEASEGSVPVDNEEDGVGVEMNPLTIFKVAKTNVEPVVITRPIRRGGATYQVPFPITAGERQFYAIRWLIGAVVDRPKPKKKLFPEVMAQELLEAYHGRGKVIKMRDDMHRLADSNKAYSHYRWG